MTYKKNLVACIKVNGAILREKGDKVELPFGSEYSILLKNLDSVRMTARITIDGQGITDGTDLVLGAHGSLEIERFIKNGNLDRGNKLKFIERTAAVEKGRGTDVEDGLIRIEFKREKVTPAPIHVPIVYDHYYHYYGYSLYYPYWHSNSNITYTSTSNISSTAQQNAQSGTLNASINTSGLRGAKLASSVFSNFNDAGITVPGTESQQKFSAASWFQTEEQSEVVVLKLVGYRGKIKVTKAVTTKMKAVCQTCKLRNKPTSKFCSACGTSLEII